MFRGAFSFWLSCSIFLNQFFANLLVQAIAFSLNWRYSWGVEILKPTDINADRNTAELTITWNDGATSVIPFGLLRNACPCAECRGGHENMRSDPDPDAFSIPLVDARTTRMVNLTGAGNYALNIEWEDGHTAGIYSWRFLKALDPERQTEQEEPPDE